MGIREWYRHTFWRTPSEPVPPAEIGVDWNFKFTTTPPKGPDPEEVKAVMGEWKDYYYPAGDPEILEAIAVFGSVEAARATDKAHLSHNRELWLNSFDFELEPGHRLYSNLLI